MGGGRDGWRGSETDEGVNLGCGDILSLRLRVDGGEPPRRRMRAGEIIRKEGNKWNKKTRIED